MITFQLSDYKEQVNSSHINYQKLWPVAALLVAPQKQI